MSDLDLNSAISDFVKLGESYEVICRPGNNLTRVLCDLYAAKGARSIKMCVEARLGKPLLSLATLGDEQLKEEHFVQKGLAKHEVLERMGRDLLAAVNLEDKAGILDALEKMGIMALCPPPEQLLSRLESAVGCLIGRAQLIPLVELSVFAIEVGDSKRASKYAGEARILNPTASELHDLCVVEGTIELGGGNIGRAIAYLAESIHVCLANEFSRLACSVRAPNMMLAKKLFAEGRVGEVVRYLLQCQRVWEHQKKHFATWIDAIKAGERPEFVAPGFLSAMNLHSVKLQHLCAIAHLQEEEAHLPSPKSSAEGMSRREKLRAGYGELVIAATKGGLPTSKN